LARSAFRRTGPGAICTFQARAGQLHQIALRRIGSPQSRAYISEDAAILPEDTSGCNQAPLI
jgi:hypothetical protein